mmetsp:Transcript_36441/g.64206  ORF Transcript_36441/g.64206 Transcript_36441/m.64206 type:complete len:103 (-) Transcript_36441:46-354(-)
MQIIQEIWCHLVVWLVLQASLTPLFQVTLGRSHHMSTRKLTLDSSFSTPSCTFVFKGLKCPNPALSSTLLLLTRQNARSTLILVVGPTNERIVQGVYRHSSD